MVRRRLQEFELGSSIAVGTVGTIYRARERATDAERAVKVLLPAVSQDPLITARFEREMLILSKLSHSNIIRYYGGGSSDGQLFYAMELVDGATLKQVLHETGPLSYGEAVTCGIQISSALQHAHNHGIIHRDLKPANLLITAAGDIRLADFGIARDTKAEDITSSGLTVGTYAYMSPEQITGSDDVSHQTDLYAFGCLMFEMLVGRAPFEGANFAQLFEQHLNCPAPRLASLLSDCPEALDRLVAQLLEKRAEQRPFNARTVQGALLELRHQHRAGSDLADPGRFHEDPAAVKMQAGRAQIVHRVHAFRERAQLTDVPWWKIATIALALMVVVLLAWIINQ